MPKGLDITKSLFAKWLSEGAERSFEKDSKRGREKRIPAFCIKFVLEVTFFKLIFYDVRIDLFDLKVFSCFIFVLILR